MALLTPAPRAGTDIRRRPLLRRAVLGLGVLALAWFLVAFLYAPNAALVTATLGGTNGSIGSRLAGLGASDRALRAVRDTVVVALVSCVTASVVGIVQTVVLEVVPMPLRRVLLAAYALPLVFGSVSAVTGYSLLYGPSGVLTGGLLQVFPGLGRDWFSGMPAVIIVHTFTLTGYHFLFLRPALRRVDFSLVEAARSLGMRPWRAMVRVVLPVLRPVLVATTLMVFVESVGSFAAPSLLGGADLTMVGPLIQALTQLGRPDLAGVLGLALGLVTLALLAWALRLERSARISANGRAARPFQPLALRHRTSRVAVTVVAFALAAINVAPLLVTVVLAFSPPAAVRNGRIDGGVTGENFARLFDTPGFTGPILNSLALSLLAVPAAVAIGTAVATVAHRRPGRVTDAVQTSTFLPYFLPGVLVPLGFLLAFGSGNLLVGGTVLVGTYWILPLAYVVVLLPVAVRFTRASYAGLDPSLEEAARSLGASATRRFRRVTLPLLAPVLLQVSALGFHHTLNEYPVSVLLYNVNNTPLGVALGSLVVQNDPQSAGIAPCYVVIVTAASLTLVLLADRMAIRAARRGTGET